MIVEKYLLRSPNRRAFPKRHLRRTARLSLLANLHPPSTRIAADNTAVGAFQRNDLLLQHVHYIGTAIPANECTRFFAGKHTFYHFRLSMRSFQLEQALIARDQHSLPAYGTHKHLQLRRSATATQRVACFAHEVSPPFRLSKPSFAKAPTLLRFLETPERSRHVGQFAPEAPFAP